MKVRDFIHKIDRIGSPQFYAELSQRVATEGLKLITRGFTTQTDPYGKKWKRVEPHKGHRSILFDSGRLRMGFIARTIWRGVRFINEVEYALRQQKGGTSKHVSSKGNAYEVKLVPRRMLPEADKGLPKTWRDMVRTQWIGLLQEYMR